MLIRTSLCASIGRSVIDVTIERCRRHANTLIAPWHGAINISQTQHSSSSNYAAVLAVRVINKCRLYSRSKSCLSYIFMTCGTHKNSTVLVFWYRHRLCDIMVSWALRLMTCLLIEFNPFMHVYIGLYTSAYSFTVVSGSWYRCTGGMDFVRQVYAYNTVLMLHIV